LWKWLEVSSQNDQTVHIQATNPVSTIDPATSALAIHLRRIQTVVGLSLTIGRLRYESMPLKVFELIGLEEQRKLLRGVVGEFRS